MREFNKRPRAYEAKRQREKVYYKANRTKWRETQLRKEFGITSQRYAEMLQEQGGTCAICEGQQTYRGKKALAVDHCHATGVVRGLLCNHCNHALGHAKDDPERLRAMADYLERSRGVVSAIPEIKSIPWVF